MADRFDNFFEPLENTSPYLKAAAMGEAGTGKTYSLALIAAGLWSHIKSTKPIVLFDTETSAKFLRPFFESRGIEVLLKQSRTLSDLVTTMQYCAEGKSDILFIDSITHPYENFVEAYKKKKGLTRLRVQDWGVIKPEWKREFADRMVLGKYHVLFTGRQGFVYDQVEDEDGKKEWVKSGVKMNVDRDTGYEPDILIYMARRQEFDGHGKLTQWREGVILKDRSTLIDGKLFKNPKYEDFKPVIDFLLTNPKERPVTVSHDDADMIRDAENDYADTRGCKTELERIDNLIDKVAAGSGKSEKTLRIRLKEIAFMGETSDTAISSMSRETLADAYSRIEPWVRAIDWCLQRESRVYPVPKAVEAARAKYLHCSDFSDAELTLETIKGYATHIHEKLEALKTEPATA